MTRRCRRRDDGRPAPVEAPKAAETMVTEVAKAYYPLAVAAADHARTRAQAGYTIASAVAAALVAAGIFADFAELPAVVQGLGFAALLGWLAAALGFMVAVSRRRPTPQEDEDPTSPQENVGALAFVRDVMGDAKQERAAVERWLAIATGAVGVAMALTLLTVGGILLQDSPDPKRAATVTLTADGAAAFAASCDETRRAVRGRLDPGDLGDAFVPVEVAAGVCGSDEVDLRLRRKDVATVAIAKPSSAD
ncbi:MAG: hypothetical protein GXY03_07925 [Solirubrobacterales bacterium]|nr:hypothetical protein [Solirubrobacterales bacterium]